MIKEIREQLEHYILENKNTILNDSGKVVYLSFRDLVQFDTKLAEAFTDNHEEFIKYFEITMNDMLDVKKNVRFREVYESFHQDLWKVRAEHIGKFVKIRGQISVISTISPKVTSTKNECRNCGNVINVLQLGDVLRPVTRCSCGARNGFKELSREYQDYMKIIIEEEQTKVPIGQQPGKMIVELYDDLTRLGIFKNLRVNKTVVVNGIIRAKEKGKAKAVEHILYMHAHSIELEDESISEKYSGEDVKKFKLMSKDKDIKTKLVDSYCPEVVGMKDIKQALILQVLGGNNVYDVKHNLLQRGTFSICIVGDVGTAKTKLAKLSLRYAPPGARMASGKGASLQKDELIVIKRRKDILHVPIGEYKFKKGDRCLTLNDNYKVLWGEVFGTIEHKPKELLHLKAEGGREIKVTPDHSIFTIRDQKLVSIPANELKINDCMVGLKKLPKISEQNKFTKLEAEVLGIFIGDGWLHRVNKKTYSVQFAISTKKQHVLDKIIEYADYKNTHYHVCTKMPNVFRVTIYGKAILEDFEKLLQDCAYKKAPQKFIPKWIFNTSKDMKLAFLEWYKCTDGFTTSSKHLMNDLSLLFCSIGMTCSWDTRKPPKNCYIKGRLIKSKYDNYSIKSQRKGLVNSPRYNSCHFDNLGLEYNQKTRCRLSKLDRKSIQPKLTKLFHSDMNFYRIKSIDKLDNNEPVYDISCAYERFIGGFGQILCHNSAVGLVATVVHDKELGEWVLRAGAVALAHNSVCFIDELDKIEKDNLNNLNNTMSDLQTPIDKAGINTTIQTNTAIIGVANPVDKRFHDDEEIENQITLPDDIRDRLDLIFVIRDKVEEDMDRKVIGIVLDTYNEEHVETPFSQEDVKGYLNYMSALRPVLSKEAKSFIEDEYVSLRKVGKKQGKTRFSARLGESIIRLATATAKLHGRKNVTLEDVECGQKMLIECMKKRDLYDDGQGFSIEKIEGITSQTKRDRYKSVKECILILSKKFEMIFETAIIDQCKERFLMEDDDVKEQIDKLKESGIIYEPKRKQYQLCKN